MRTPDTIPELRDNDRQIARMRDDPVAFWEAHYHELPLTPFQKHEFRDRLQSPPRSPNVLLWCVAACIVWAGAYVLFTNPNW